MIVKDELVSMLRVLKEKDRAWISSSTYLPKSDLPQLETATEKFKFVLFAGEISPA
jgi:hypothetical protein